jgi:integrase
MELKWLKENPATKVNPCTYETILFTDFLIDWLDVVRSKIAVATYASYVSNVEKSIIPFFDPKQLTLKQLEHRPQYIQEYYQHLLAEGLAPTTVIRRHANVHSCLQYAFRMGLIKSNPADRIEKPSKDRFHTNIYNQHELQQLFLVAKDDPLELPILAAAFYGLRCSEVIGLKWSAIDFERKTIRINHTVVQTTINGKTKIIPKDGTKTVSSYRTLPLVPPFEKQLFKVKETQIQNRQYCGSSYCKDYIEYVCVDPMGHLLKPNFVTQHFSLLLERNGLKKIRFHDLRYSCASLLYASGVRLKEIQEWLGHSDIGTTSNIYTHLDCNSKRISANAMQASLRFL